MSAERNHTIGFGMGMDQSVGAGARSGAEPAGADDPAAQRFRALPGTLYVVATPLGNLRDMTLRAIDVLASADTIAAEDTRVTGVLLRNYGISTRPLSLREHNESSRAAQLVSLLRAGRSVALVSDAGTPAVSDPGAKVVRAVRDAGLPVVPVPGPNAAIAAVSAAGLLAERFVFIGFLPPGAKARREILGLVAQVPAALVIYEAPHRVLATVSVHHSTVLIISDAANSRCFVSQSPG